MRIACIYFPISSVGGIATECSGYQNAVRAMGHTFDVIRCSKGKTILPYLFSSSKQMRGGDTYIMVDGDCSHHPSQVKNTIRWLERNYDALLFIHPCPHATKAYGTEPYWLEMYKGCTLPKAVKFLDAYVSTYLWIKDAIPYIDVVYVNQPAYANSLEAADITGAKILPIPFEPNNREIVKTPERLVIWPSQWKDIKGIRPFLEQVPSLFPIANVELYSCGIRYYQLRTQDSWRQAIKTDHFKGYNGDGEAIYWGYVTPREIRYVMSRAWCSVNLQGLSTRVRHPFYRQGSYNNTELEALYFGAWPVVAEQCLKSPIPDEFLIPVRDEKATDLREAIEIGADQPLHGSREGMNAREWVMDNHGSHIGAEILVEDLSS